MQYIVLGASFAIVVAMIVGGLSNRRVFLYLAAFVLPLMGISVRLFVFLSWQKVLFPIGLVVAVGAGLASWKSVTSGRVPLIALLAYSVALTIVFWGMDAVDGHYFTLARSMGWGLAQTDYRYPVQLVTFLTMWGLALISFFFIREIRDFDAVVNGYITGCLVSVISGFYQLTALRFGLPWVDLSPSGFTDAERLGRQFETQTGEVYYRMYGLGGEPKNTAGFAVVAVTILLAAYLFDEKNMFYIRRMGTKLVILLVGIFLTGSTSSLIASSAVVAVTFVLMLRAGKVQRAAMRVVLMAVVLAGLAGVTGFAYIESFYQARIEARIAEGYDRIAYAEPRDAALVEYALERPESMFFGHGVGGVDFRLIRYADPLFVSRGVTITPSYFMTRTLGELGVVGLVLTFLVFISWWRSTRSYEGANVALSLGMVGILFASGSAFPAFVMIGSACAAACDRVREARFHELASAQAVAE